MPHDASEHCHFHTTRGITCSDRDLLGNECSPNDSHSSAQYVPEDPSQQHTIHVLGEESSCHGYKETNYVVVKSAHKMGGMCLPREQQE